MAIELTQDVVHISPRFRLRISVGKLKKSRQKGDDFDDFFQMSRAGIQ